MSLHIDIISNNDIIKRHQVDWLYKYNIKLNNIKDLINYCNNYIMELKDIISLFSKNNINNMKEQICNRIMKNDTLHELIYYIINKGTILQKEYNEVLIYNEEYYKNELFNFINLKDFLLNYNISNYILDFYYS
jgi:hypothetical protein